MSRQIRLVVNPSAGKGRALELLPQVAGTLRDGGANLEILLSRDFAEAQAMTRRAIQDGVDVLAVMGCDGMMHLGVNTSAAAHLSGRSRTTLGLIPVGVEDPDREAQRVPEQRRVLGRESVREGLPGRVGRERRSGRRHSSGS